MKKIASVFMALLLSIALAVPALAANDGYLPYQIEDDSCYILYLDGTTEKIYWVYSHTKDEVSITYKAGKIKFALVEGGTIKWNTFERREDRIWDMGASKTSTTGSKEFDFANCTIVEASQNILDMSDGSFYYSLACDGSSCPATDVDFNNVCDDCQKVLTYALRSSLLTYAQNTHIANAISTWPSMTYWVITDNSEGGYSTYISDAPFTYGDGLLKSTGDIRTSTVIEMSTGQNGGRGWSYIDGGSVTADGEAVAGSQVIDGFFPTPLWKTMNKVTQGEMGLLTGETAGTMKIMALSGVGCLALLAVLKLFGKRSLIFRS